MNIRWLQASKSSMKNSVLCRAAAAVLLTLASAAIASAQDMMSAADMKAMEAHMQMTGLRPKDAADSVRAAKLIAELRSSTGKY